MSVDDDAMKPAADDATAGRLDDDEVADVAGGIFTPTVDGPGVQVIG